jgi:hypothetical protein
VRRDRSRWLASVTLAAERDITPVFDLFDARWVERRIGRTATTRGELHVAQKPREARVIDAIVGPHRAHRAEQREIEKHGLPLAGVYAGKHSIGGTIWWTDECAEHDIDREHHGTRHGTSSSTTGDTRDGRP